MSSLSWLGFIWKELEVLSDIQTAELHNFTADLFVWNSTFRPLLPSARFNTHNTDDLSFWKITFRKELKFTHANLYWCCSFKLTSNPQHYLIAFLSLPSHAEMKAFLVTSTCCADAGLQHWLNKKICLKVSLNSIKQARKWKYLVSINLSKTKIDLILMPTRNRHFKSVDQINSFV